MTEIVERQEWMSVLAKADLKSLVQLWKEHERDNTYSVLRQPETGLVMVRGRMGGHGAQFNAGEVTVTRCSVENPEGKTGHAYILGRSKTHATIAAQIDADLQVESLQKAVTKDVVMPLRKAREVKVRSAQEKVAATKVDFFTMVRGED